MQLKSRKVQNLKTTGIRTRITPFTTVKSKYLQFTIYFNLGLNFYENRVSRKEVRQYLMPFIFHKDSKHLFYNSMVLLMGSKGLAVASPYILKQIVDSMTMATSVDFYTAAISIGVFGLARLGSTIF